MTLPGDVDYGYGSWAARLTWDQLNQKETWSKLHPEFRRRFKAMVDEATRQNVHLGVGQGWRIQPTTPKPGFAVPGNSNHEGFMEVGAVAIDSVPEIGWNWMEANCDRFGLRTFRNVNAEPWHVQPKDIPAGRDFRKTPWTLPVFDLPILITDNWPPFRPAHGEFSLWPFAKNKPVLNLNDRGDPVRYLQGVLKKQGRQIRVSGIFNLRTELIVRRFQRAHKLVVDGIVGAKSWYVIDRLADR
jgi:hypothetical protein